MVVALTTYLGIGVSFLETVLADHYVPVILVRVICTRVREGLPADIALADGNPDPAGRVIPCGLVTTAVQHVDLAERFTPPAVEVDMIKLTILISINLPDLICLVPVADDANFSAYNETFGLVEDLHFGVAWHVTPP
jgi:hypothetical protein